MVTEIRYTYLGTNGILTTPIHLEGIYSTKKYLLTADENKQLTKDNIHYFQSIEIPEEDLNKWYEVLI